MKARYLVCLGLAIRRQRRARTLTQVRLATAVGLTRTSIVNIETGVQNPSVLTLAGIAEALGTSASALLAQAWSAA